MPRSTSVGLMGKQYSNNTPQSHGKAFFIDSLLAINNSSSNTQSKSPIGVDLNHHQSDIIRPSAFVNNTKWEHDNETSSLQKHENTDHLNTSFENFYKFYKMYNVDVNYGSTSQVNGNEETEEEELSMNNDSVNECMTDDPLNEQVYSQIIN